MRESPQHRTRTAHRRPLAAVAWYHGGSARNDWEMDEILDLDPKCTQCGPEHFTETQLLDLLALAVSLD